MIVRRVLSAVLATLTIGSASLGGELVPWSKMAVSKPRKPALPQPAEPDAARNDQGPFREVPPNHETKPEPEPAPPPGPLRDPIVIPQPTPKAADLIPPKTPRTPPKPAPAWHRVKFRDGASGEMWGTLEADGLIHPAPPRKPGEPVIRRYTSMESIPLYQEIQPFSANSANFPIFTPPAYCPPGIA